MDKKTYEALHRFTEHLYNAKRSWPTTPGMKDYVADCKAKLGDKFGKTDDEIARHLLTFVATLITQPEEDDNYPTINFLDAKSAQDK